MTSPLAAELRRIHHLDSVAPEHPIRRAADELDRLERVERERTVLSRVHEDFVGIAKHWHRRMQQAEARCAAAHEGKARSGGMSLGRALANSAAHHYRDRMETAIALLREAQQFLNHIDADELDERIDAFLGDSE